VGRGLRGLLAIAVATAGLAVPAAHAAPGDLLPDLVADPSDDLVLATDSVGGTNRLLLRFAGYLHNVGAGPLDIRGSRPSSSVPMGVVQRVRNGNAWRSEPSPAQLFYETGDGHNHWHLMHAARYSLWNGERTAEVAPAMKVGFCLEDSQRVETHGPRNPVYSTDDPAQRFCMQGDPAATTVFEGISPGWRDVYHNRLAFQWVDVSEVQPGSYWLRSEVDPDGVILESSEANQPAWSAEPAVIPGYVAQSVGGDIQPGQVARVGLGAERFGSPGGVAYRIVSGPSHGTLDVPAGTWRSDPGLTYTPAPGFEGTDTFTYMARDATSPYPRSPAVATVTIRVGRPAPVVQIAGAPESVVAGTSVQLQATVVNDDPGVTWTAAGGGTITAAGLYTAPSVPPPGDGVVTVAATSARGGRDERRIRITPSPAENPKPVPAAGDVTPLSAPKRGPLGRPQASRIGRRLILTVVAARAGTVRLTAYAGRRRVGTCVTRTPANRPFTCRVRLPRGVKATAKIRVVASLRVKGRLVAVTTRNAARVKAAAHDHGAHRH
jgi:hypothetical protein